MKIPFNRPCITGNELTYIKQAVENGKLSGNGEFSKKCQQFLTADFQFNNPLLTTSCTAALEMIALLLDVKEGDEIIIPSFTFVSTANAFALRGAKIIFADSMSSHPNIDAPGIENLITEKTKAIVVVHYGSVAVDMKTISELAAHYSTKFGHRIYIVEDAAHAITARHENKFLGNFGDFAAFSFHETKNIQCGEGGLLLVNDPAFVKRSEVIWEKGTSRVAFSRGEIQKYDWIDIGSSYLLSEIAAAYLLGQFENIDLIQRHRREIWNAYDERFRSLNMESTFELPIILSPQDHNCHIYYLVCKDKTERDALISHLASQNILAVFHYQSLHRSVYGSRLHDGRTLPNAEKFSDRLVRLPLYHELSINQADKIIEAVTSFYSQSTS